LSESDDRAVTFLIDAQTPSEFHLVDQQVRSAIQLKIAAGAGGPNG
jgi:hypothetical protein